VLTALCREQLLGDHLLFHDEWAVSDRRYLSESSMALLERRVVEEEVVTEQLLPA